MLRLLAAAGTAFVLAAAAAGTARAQSGLPAAGSSFRDCPECPEMVVVPAGGFTMGAAPGEEKREGIPSEYRGRAQPQHRVAVARPFAIGRFEVTLGEFAAFVRETGHAAGGPCYRLHVEAGGFKLKPDNAANWRNPGFRQTDRSPVVCVSWDDAKAYVAWLGRKTGRRYALPSEAQWEYAARAGSPHARFWGDDPGPACLYANVRDQAFLRRLNDDAKTNNREYENDPSFWFQCNDGQVFTTPVGGFRANAYGLYDMLGNVWEWVEDCWNENYNGAPADGSAWVAGDCSQRVARGGSWNYGPRILRSADRFRETAGYRLDSSGFRVARAD
ncbi:MAG: formylglycine-generating enzyme family protein [Alphaproteobacteria bacterium]|nr:formylglycine-generating enzyme family protein [Alphaproteobacteria bacterium]